MFIRRSSRSDTGLFGAIEGDARVDSLGVVDAYVYGCRCVGIIAGANYGVVAASYTTGALRGDSAVARYSHASAHTTRQSGAAGAGYATGRVTSSGTRVGVSGLLTTTGAWTVTDSYSDVTSGTASGIVGKTTAEQRTPTSCAGIYANRNVDVDGVSGADGPWDFGGANEYPVLKFGGMDPDFQRRGNYDRDGNVLIEITTLAQLNAVRWDLDGDAAQDSTSAADWLKYKAAFTVAKASLGCPDTADADANPGPCLGCEFAADLDFDMDGNGATYTGTGNNAASDSDDAYHNGGGGWDPIGGPSNGVRYSSTFKGNGHTISNTCS